MLSMFTKIENYIEKNIDRLTSIKNLYLMFITAMAIMLFIGNHHLLVRSDIAHDYIKTLEEHIGDDDMDDVISETDAYVDYYNY